MVLQNRGEVRHGVGTKAAVERLPLYLTAEHALRQSPYRALHALRCVEQSGTLILEGTLPSFFLKQQAQEAVRQLAGATRVQNLINVG